MQKIIFETIKQLHQSKYFIDALLSAGLFYQLKAKGPWTLFLPLDQTFGQIPKIALRLLFSEPKKLAAVIGYHIISGAFSAAELINTDKLATLSGHSLKISVSDEIDILVDDALITKPDIKCANGIIHVIDAVLIPNPDRQPTGLGHRALEPRQT